MIEFVARHSDAGWLADTVMRALVFRTVNILTRGASPLGIMVITALAVCVWLAIRRWVR